MIHFLEETFGQQFWNQSAIIFTKLSMEPQQVKRREKINKKTDDEIAEEFLNHLETKFPERHVHKYLMLDACYDNDVKDEKKAFDRGMDALWTMIETQPNLPTEFKKYVLTETLQNTAQDSLKIEEKFEEKFEEMHSKIENLESKVRKIEDQNSIKNSKIKCWQETLADDILRRENFKPSGNIIKDTVEVIRSGYLSNLRTVILENLTISISEQDLQEFLSICSQKLTINKVRLSEKGFDSSFQLFMKYIKCRELDVHNYKLSEKSVKELLSAMENRVHYVILQNEVKLDVYAMRDYLPNFKNWSKQNKIYLHLQ